MRRKSRRYLVAAACLLAVSAAAVGIALASSSATPPPDWLRQVSANVASENGDSSPTSLQFALTTAQDAAPLVGLSATDPSVQSDPGRQEYVVVMTGQFEAVNAFGPGAPPPKGTTVVITVDPVSHTILDFGITPAAVDTASVGGLTPFTLQ